MTGITVERLLTIFPQFLWLLECRCINSDLSFLTLDRSDFIYDIVEPMKPSVPAAGTKKISRKRPTVSSQFKVCGL